MVQTSWLSELNYLVFHRRMARMPAPCPISKELIVVLDQTNRVFGSVVQSYLKTE
jgi:hypothetical protein